MQSRRRDHRRGAALVACHVVAALAGCSTSASQLPPGVTAGQQLPVRSSTASRAFPQARPVDLPLAGETSVSGALNGPDDVALFALGPALRGDRITVDVTGNDGINTVAAVFNADGEIIQLNDDRSYYGGLIDPFLSLILREDDSNVMVAVSVSRGRYFTSSQGRYTSGSFQLRLRRDPGYSAQVNPQVVMLEFGGGTGIRIAQETPIDVPPFDAGQIAARLGGQNEYIKDAIVAHMAADFAGLNVLLLRSDRDAPPAGDVTRVYLGGDSDRFLGLSDSVDTYNGNARQKSIIFTESIRSFNYLNPTADDVALGIANVASHELGHLLGLQHTSDPLFLMTPAASAQQILFVNASFGVAPLSDDLFPVGVQNDPRQLGLAVGLQSALAAWEQPRNAVATRIGGIPDHDPPAASPLTCRHGALCFTAHTGD